MGKFKVGDRVSDNDGGGTGTVIGVNDTILVNWDGWGVSGTWPADGFTLLPRKFTLGDFVRVVATDADFANEVGIVFEDDGDDEEDCPYSVGLFDDFESEENFSASELIPWLPLVGERVIEADVEEDETGTVIGTDGEFFKVLWDSFPHAQNWLVSDLEPADETESALKAGDTVEYTNPFFSRSSKAEILRREGNCLHVKFEPDSIFADGFYHEDFFSKAA